MPDNLKLPVSALKLNIDLSAVEVPEISRQNHSILGQSRAKSALTFGVAMKTPGYNIYVMGEPGTGRLWLILSEEHTSELQ